MLDIDIVVYAAKQVLANSRKQMGLLPRHASANQYPLRRQGQNQVVRELSERIRHRIPDRTVDGQTRRRRTGTGFNRRSRGEPLYACAVKTTITRPVIPWGTCYANVSEFGMVPAA